MVAPMNSLGVMESTKSELTYLAALGAPSVDTPVLLVNNLISPFIKSEVPVQIIVIGSDDYLVWDTSADPMRLTVNIYCMKMLAYYAKCGDNKNMMKARSMMTTGKIGCVLLPRKLSDRMREIR